MTDHKALTFLQSAKHLNATLAWWALRLQTFSLTFAIGLDGTMLMRMLFQGRSGQRREEEPEKNKDLRSPEVGGGGEDVWSRPSPTTV